MATFLLHGFAIAGAMNALLPLAAALRGRGHRVVFAGFPAGRRFVASAGFDFEPLFERFFPDEERHQIRRSRGLAGLARARRQRRELEPLLQALLSGEQRELGEVYARVRPDLVLVHGSNFYAPLWALAAHGHGVPAVYFSALINHGVSLRIPPTWTPLPPGDTLPRRLRIAASWGTRLCGRALATWLYARAGLLPDPFWFLPRLARRWGYPPERLQWRGYFFPRLALPELFEGPRGLDFADADTDRRYLGLLVRPRETAEPASEDPLEDWLADDGRPLVYCSLGSLGNLGRAARLRFFSGVLAAIAARPGCKLLLSLSRQLPRESLGEVPPNAQVVDWAPQMRVLEHTALMLHHGGLSSVLECLAHDVPAIAFPIGFDQPGVAARIVHHRLGLAGELRRANAATIGALIDTVLADSGYRGRVEALRRESEQRDETGRALAWLEELAMARRADGDGVLSRLEERRHKNL